METIVSCVKSKDWVSPKTGQTIPIYSVGLSDGRGGESFGKEIPVGTPMSELQIETSSYGLKIKWIKGDQKQPFQKQRSGNESFALSYSKDLVVAGKVDLKNILSTADRFYGWLEAKKTGPKFEPTNGHATQPAPSVAPQLQHTPSTSPSDDLPF